MNINRINAFNVSRIYQKNSGAGKVARSKASGRRDDIVLSDSAKAFHQALKAIENMPEVNEAKVSEALGKIKKGSYHVDNGELASKMIKNAFFIK